MVVFTRVLDLLLILMDLKLRSPRRRRGNDKDVATISEHLVLSHIHADFLIENVRLQFELLLL